MNVLRGRNCEGSVGSARVSAGTRESLTLHLTQLNSTSQRANRFCSVSICLVVRICDMWLKAELRCLARLNVLLVAGAVGAGVLAPGLLVEAASPSVDALRMSALEAVSGQGLTEAEVGSSLISNSCRHRS